MSEIVKIVDSLEVNIQKLLLKVTQLEEQNNKLKSELSRTIENFNLKNEEINNLNQQINALKIANSLLGSDDNTKETKSKINSLIREIDYCIAQLSD